jgi:hypothetical protein
MARKFTVTSGLTSLAASTTKVACQLATGSTITCTVIGFDVTFDSTATGSGAVPVRVELVRATGASSGGSTYTPKPWLTGDTASITTARINDTSDGAGVAILKSWLVSPTAGLVYQFPLGREVSMSASDFFELRLISQSGMTTCNYEANLDFEE